MSSKLAQLAQSRIDVQPCSHLQRYSQSHWPGVLQAAGMTLRERSSRRLLFRVKGVSGIVPGKIMERSGTVRPAAL